jgi:hypothetical protein
MVFVSTPEIDLIALLIGVVGLAVSVADLSVFVTVPALFSGNVLEIFVPASAKFVPVPARFVSAPEIDLIALLIGVVVLAVSVDALPISETVPDLFSGNVLEIFVPASAKFAPVPARFVSVPEIDLIALLIGVVVLAVSAADLSIFVTFPIFLRVFQAIFVSVLEGCCNRSYRVCADSFCFDNHTGDVRVSVVGFCDRIYGFGICTVCVYQRTLDVCTRFSFVDTRSDVLGKR